MEEKRSRQRGYAVPLLEDQNSDFNGWYSRLKLKLDAKGLWEDFCVKPEDVPSKEDEPVKYKPHMARRKEARWKIDKTLSPDLSKTVEEEPTPFGVLERLRKMFVGATKLSLVHQLRAVMEMKYERGKNLLVFIEELKQGFTKLEYMGLPLQDSLKPYILVMVLNDKFENIMRPYLVHSLAESTELEFDKLVELLESSYLEVERQEQLQGRDSDRKHHGESALVLKARNNIEIGTRVPPTTQMMENVATVICVDILSMAALSIVRSRSRGGDILYHADRVEIFMMMTEILLGNEEEITSEMETVNVMGTESGVEMTMITVETRVGIRQSGESEAMAEKPWCQEMKTRGLARSRH